jgi:glycosyltransferase involved in cell wall biosynthesis
MVMLRRLLGLPIVLTEHNGQFENILARPGLRWMSGIAYRGADIVLAVGEGQRRFLQEHFPGIKRLQIVSNMVDTRRFVPSPLPPVTGDYRLLFVGLLGSTPVKGVHVLLDALALLKERAVISVHLDLVGDGEIRPEYEAQARRLGVDEMVTFHGLQPREKVARLLQESHALVLPSLSESQSVVVLEALASGRPVVATRCGGPEFLIDSTNGLVVEPGKARPLAEAIEQLLTTLDQYDPEAIAANATKRYSQESVTATLTEIYQHLIPAR